MIRLINKIALFTCVSIGMLNVGKAVSSSRPIAVDALTTYSSIHTVSLPEDDAEKLINNVKVFYNPVADQITVNFKLAKQNTVAVKVMDALGNESLNLMNGRLDAGMQNLSFEASGKLTTGVYFVRVSAGAETVVKRISVR
ncbi:T9SS type A sorting domain-containing protein [Sphingobacterium sp. LRF_L2]|uniref:T9SS type A sorting domain-containing protein n=1 Tax=Sphingobacterium sp. LRF_L2 TaxID=3369421 RepID=UPI003F5E31BE